MQIGADHFLVSTDSACRKTLLIRYQHAGRLSKKEQNFVFCEWELYDGTAPEQKTKSAKSAVDIEFTALFKRLVVELAGHRCRRPLQVETVKFYYIRRGYALFLQSESVLTIFWSAPIYNKLLTIRLT